MKGEKRKREKRRKKRRENGDPQRIRFIAIVVIWSIWSIFLLRLCFNFDYESHSDNLVFVYLWLSSDIVLQVLVLALIFMWNNLYVHSFWRVISIRWLRFQNRTGTLKSYKASRTLTSSFVHLLSIERKGRHTNVKKEYKIIYPQGFQSILFVLRYFPPSLFIVSVLSLCLFYRKDFIHYLP